MLLFLLILSLLEIKLAACENEEQLGQVTKDLSASFSIGAVVQVTSFDALIGSEDRDNKSLSNNLCIVQGLLIQQNDHSNTTQPPKGVLLLR
ncbi:Hypothetical predicted protein [Cloeon dipterum]|uniref:Uncharacterized protein n=1 Tax=Cloeon dipterum TaxID=197152 RepID=A0A8S1DNQ0_9INSE|nr:Hypothetical predicted protein [Cloeon dipterum]